LAVTAGNTPVAELVAAAGEDAVLTAEDSRSAYARDESGAPAALPDIVVLPADAAAVARVLRVAHRHRMPVVPVGARTGLSGGAVPIEGGIALGLERLTRIDPVDRANLTVTAGAGARTAEVAAAALAAGLFYPPDPASLERSTIGGNIAENAGGPRCFKYGVTAEYVLALEAVTADGRVFRTGRATRKNTTGLRLAQLLVGSEGTLAVVTEATLRLIPAPARRVAALARFDSAHAAGEAVVAILHAGLVPSALELLDHTCLRLLGLPGEALLLIECDGADTERELAEVTKALGGATLELANDEADVERLWQVRRGLSPALAAAGPDWVFEDVCVPIARIPDALEAVETVAERYGVRIPVVAHAGDGNLHPSILFDRRAGEEDRARAAERDLLRAVLELGGTISAEHGVGFLKLPWLRDDLDPVAIDEMLAIKRALDPLGILNPGKLFPS
jgi:glycolate oxidase